MKRVMLALIMPSLILLTSCGTDIYDNFREVERLELIRCMAVDLEGGQICITAVSDSEGGVYEKTAPTIAEAVTELERNSREYDAYFSHLENVVIGRSLAEAGVGGVLDYIARAMKMRMDIGLFVSTCDRAGDLMGQNSPGQLNAMQEDAPKLGLGSVLTCRDIAANLASDGCSLIFAVSGDGEETVPDGCGVIADGTLVKLLSREDMTPVSLITGSAEGGIYTALWENTPVALNLTGSKVSVSADFTGDSVSSPELSMKLTFNVAETVYPADISRDIVRLGLQAQLESQVREASAAAIADSQRLGADYMGIGSMLNCAYPMNFYRVREAWEELFPDLDISVNVSAEIVRTYDLNEPERETGNGENRIVTK